MYTGFPYMVTVFFLLLPYAFIARPLSALGFCLVNAMQRFLRRNPCATSAFRRLDY